MISYSSLGLYKTPPSNKEENVFQLRTRIYVRDFTDFLVYSSSPTDVNLLLPTFVKQTDRVVDPPINFKRCGAYNRKTFD